ncbi:response regulator [Fontisphaera persica]|uniref:ATP-binding protein n=1 Tax=Fontisphaera persica TaxID=2974023 RepID=UPI0024BFC835|nr:ATP-binding protein [Fontisphaera persica]WCJ58541.1 response regulator [Fontisphaera persica]
MSYEIGFDLLIPGQYIKQALAVSLLSVWVLVGLFFYLNHYTRRRYFTIWAAAWMFYALWLTLNLALGHEDAAPWMTMVKQWCISATALFLFWGGLRFLGQRVRQSLAALFFGFLFVWSYYGAYQLENALQIRLPIFGLIAVASLRVGYCFLAYRRRRPYVGAGLLAVGFGLWGLYHVGFPFLYYQPELFGAAFLIATVLQLFIAVSMIVLVLEEARHTHHLAFLNLSKQAEEAQELRSKVSATEERYRKLFENAGQPIIIARPDDLTIQEVNQAAARLLGAGAPQELCGRSLLHFCPGQPPPGMTAAEWLCTLHPLQLRRLNQELAPVEVSATPVEYDGHPAVQLFLHELTERAQLEQQLRQTEKLAALGQMISGIAHELNNPLAVVKGYLELVLQHRELAPDVRADLEKVAQESNRAAKLVQNFLAFARERPPQRELVNLNEVAQRVLELRKFAVRVAGVQVQTRLDPDLPVTLADADQIQQVLVILINNAVQAMSGRDRPGLLKVATRHAEGKVLVEVEDNGPGVPPHLETRIFEPFFTTKQVGAGTGLGLSIALSIVSEHNGRLYHARPGPEGARFVVELPVKTAPVSEAPKPPPTPPAAAPAAADLNLKILVLDDEPTITEMVSEMLSLLGCRTVGCTVPAHALELLRKQHFDLILSDIRMPEMDGRQFYAAVRQEHPSLAGRILFLTGDTVNEETRAFLKSVGNHHLGKPFQLEALRRAILEIVGQHPPAPA